MAVSTIHLPDGQTFTVQPVFGGLFFKSNELNRNHASSFPVGWTVAIHTDDDAAPVEPPAEASVHSFATPTLRRDHLYISSISNPSSADYKPPASTTRQIAMMLWISLYWYFHQPAPSKMLPPNDASKDTPLDGRPRGDWRINIKRDGVLRARNLMPKLERMGLVASLDSSVSSSAQDSGPEWDSMFVSQNMFWQIPGRLFLFTLQPTQRGGGSHPGSPISSRPGSPVDTKDRPKSSHSKSSSLQLAADVPTGPFTSSSHLPTYYPPAPVQYTFSNNVRHPVRPKPPRMGEVFYTRFVPSAGQYLSLRVASASPNPVPHHGPVSSHPLASDNHHLTTLSDTSLIQKWMDTPRVSKFWGNYVPNFLSDGLKSTNSFPVIGMWDGVPFGYFEIYWVKEDRLGCYVDADHWDRGIHVFIGEEWSRGRVQAWTSSLVHWIFTSDYRTQNVCIEPRVDNERFIQHLKTAGFVGQKEITFPHKQSWFGRLPRETWTGPAL